MMKHGLPGAQAEATAATIARLPRLARWYRHHGDQVGERSSSSVLTGRLAGGINHPLIGASQDRSRRLHEPTRECG
jgi:hypothetical protein